MSTKPPFGYAFHDPALLETALTHPSCEEDLPNYQRLEFLGDAVLGLVIAEQLYRRHPDASEGGLDAMRAGVVNGSVLAGRARDLRIGAAIRVSHAHRRHQPEPSDAMLEDALEALIGAIYLDGGLEAARQWIDRHLGDLVEAAERKARTANPKGRLQEWAQQQDGRVPEYRTIEEAGPDHAKSYTVELIFDGKNLASGTGTSKKAAEIAAAEAALHAISNQPENPA